MLIDTLLAVLPAPAEPVETGSEPEWLRVNHAIGTRPPEDFVSFITNYGTGSIAGFLYVLNPFASFPHLNFLHQLGPLLSALRASREEFPEYCPYPVFFEPGGLLPWGTSIDGDLYCWRTVGPTGRWSVVTVPRHSDPEHFAIAMSEFLAGVVSGGLKSNAYPSDLASPSFEAIGAV